MANNEGEKSRSQAGGREVAPSGSGQSRGSQVAGRRGDADPFAISPMDFLANPFAVMRRMHDEMDRMFAGALSQQTGSRAMGGLSAWSPAVEVSLRENELNVCAELPGLNPEDVKVEVTDDALIIEGERKHEQRSEEGGRWHSERRYGHFYREIPLPEGANAEQARADFSNGELKVTVPVQSPESKRRQVPISGASEAQNQPNQQQRTQQSK